MLPIEMDGPMLWNTTMSHSRVVPSSLTVASIVPPGLTATEPMLPALVAPIVVI